MMTSSIIAEQRVVLSSISWATYSALSQESDQIRGRITYDQGVLEIMSPMLSHESAKSLLGRMIERFTEICGIDLRSSASTTFRREDLQRGFEADESYYIEHAAAIRGKAEIDLSIDPPPDLVVEIEMTRSSLNKHALFASMGIPEVWRYDGRNLSLATLHEDSYTELGESRVLPSFPIRLAEELLAARSEESETMLIRCFVQQISDKT
ncbi:MAG: Uma2 family endonuclease [Candidatus Paceibacterota bacterium]